MLRQWLRALHGRGGAAWSSETGTGDVPGLGPAPYLPDATRWELAGRYAVDHALTGPWYRRRCTMCGTKCAFARWSRHTLADRNARRWARWP